MLSWKLKPELLVYFFSLCCLNTVLLHASARTRLSNLYLLNIFSRRNFVQSWNNACYWIWQKMKIKSNPKKSSGKGMLGREKFSFSAQLVVKWFTLISAKFNVIIERRKRNKKFVCLGNTTLGNTLLSYRQGYLYKRLHIVLIR